MRHGLNPALRIRRGLGCFGVCSVTSAFENVQREIRMKWNKKQCIVVSISRIRLGLTLTLRSSRIT